MNVNKRRKKKKKNGDLLFLYIIQRKSLNYQSIAMSELFRRYKQTREGSGGVGNTTTTTTTTTNNNNGSLREHESVLYPSMSSLDDPPIRRNQTRFQNNEFDRFKNSSINGRDRLNRGNLKDVRFSDPPVIRSNSSRFEKYLDIKNSSPLRRTREFGSGGYRSNRDIGGGYSKREVGERLRSPIKSLGNENNFTTRDTTRDRVSIYSTLGSTPIKNKYKVSKINNNYNEKENRQTGILSRLVNYFTHHDDDEVEVENDEFKMLKKTARDVLDIDPVQDVLDQGYEERLRRESRLKEESRIRQQEEQFKRESIRLKRQEEEERLRFEHEKYLFEERKRNEEERLRIEQERLRDEQEILRIEKEKLKDEIFKKSKKIENETISRLENELNEYNKEIKQLIKDQEIIKNENLRLKNQYDEILEKYEILEQTNDDKITIMDEKVRKLLFENKKLKDKLDSKNKENSVLRSEIEEFLNLNFK